MLFILLFGCTDMIAVLYAHFSCILSLFWHWIGRTDEFAALYAHFYCILSLFWHWIGRTDEFATLYAHFLSFSLYHTDYLPHKADKQKQISHEIGTPVHAQLPAAMD